MTLTEVQVLTCFLRGGKAIKKGEFKRMIQAATLRYTVNRQVPPSLFCDRPALPIIRRPMSQGEILNCDLTSHTSADLDPYSATDFLESAVTDFYERQDDCGRGQFVHQGPDSI